MSTIFVQIGQCGNQIGQQFWKEVNKNVEQEECWIYTHGDGYFRSVNIDSESKVVKRLSADFKSRFRDENLRIGKRGRGTNWALGYYGTKFSSEDKILEDSIDCIRKEIERCPSFTGVILMHSLSGGTGSGLGSHLTELIKDEYPMSFIMNCVVSPHASGESPLQHYNSLLCLAWLQRYSDCVVLFHNDEVLDVLEKRSKRDADSHVSFTNMNRFIANSLASLFLPTDTLKAKCGVGIGIEPWEMVRSLCPMPSVKFLHVNHLAKSKMSWEQLTSLELQYLVKHDSNGKIYHSLANLVVGRGDSTNSLRHAQETIETRVKSAYHTVPWNPFPVDLWFSSSKPIGIKDGASLTMAANYSHVTTYLDDVINKATRKYNASAYLHWYEKHGCEKETFLSAFDTLHTIVKDYDDAVT